MITNSRKNKILQIPFHRLIPLSPSTQKTKKNSSTLNSSKTPILSLKILSPAFSWKTEKPGPFQVLTFHLSPKLPTKFIKFQLVLGKKLAQLQPANWFRTNKSIKLSSNTKCKSINSTKSWSTTKFKIKCWGGKSKWHKKTLLKLKNCASEYKNFQNKINLCKLKIEKNQSLLNTNLKKINKSLNLIFCWIN